VATSIAVVAGCGNPGLACSDVGASSGVSFEFNSVVTAHEGQLLLVTACVRSTCQDLRVTNGDPQTGLVVGADVVTDSKPVPVSLTITTRRGDTVFQASQVARPVKSQPNGPRCPPTAWVAQLVASGADTLQQRD
jgi:hypothetical protein